MRDYKFLSPSLSSNNPFEYMLKLFFKEAEDFFMTVIINVVML